jgi:hypothetical protein
MPSMVCNWCDEVVVYEVTVETQADGTRIRYVHPFSCSCGRSWPASQSTLPPKQGGLRGLWQNMTEPET